MDIQKMTASYEIRNKLLCVFLYVRNMLINAKKVKKKNTERENTQHGIVFSIINL